MSKSVEQQYRFARTGETLLPASIKKRTAIAREFSALPEDQYLTTSRRQIGYRQVRYRRTGDGGWTGEILPQRPYVQNSDMSPAGKQPRDYKPFREAIAPLADRIFQHAVRIYPDFFPRAAYDVDMFAFHVTGEQGRAGSPAIEGGHYDGDERNLLYVVNRYNVAATAGVTTLFKKDNPQAPYFKKTLLSGDLITWKDKSKNGLWHNTTPITPEDPARIAVRDVFDFGINPAPIKERVIIHLGNMLKDFKRVYES